MISFNYLPFPASLDAEIISKKKNGSIMTLFMCLHFVDNSL